MSAELATNRASCHNVMASRALTASSERQPVEHFRLPAAFDGGLVRANLVWITFFRYQTERLCLVQIVEQQSRQAHHKGQAEEKVLRSRRQVAAWTVLVVDFADEAGWPVALLLWVSIHFWSISFSARRELS